MKKILTSLAAVLLVAASATAASAAYQGGWYTDNNVGGSEILYLGDNSDDTYRGFSGTGHFCVRRGASYATMRRIITSEPDQITWWIDAECGNYSRVCVRNSYGRSACSTYYDHGW